MEIKPPYEYCEPNTHRFGKGVRLEVSRSEDASFLREDHKSHFNLTHTYLVNESFSYDCVTLTSQTSFVMSEWYYKTRTKADVYAFIVPLLDHGSLRDKSITPTAITTTPTSFVSTLGTFFLMLEFFQWSTVVVVHDLSANSGYHPIADRLVPLLREHNMQVLLIDITSKKSMNFGQELSSFRLISRGVHHCQCVQGEGSWIHHLELRRFKRHHSSGSFSFGSALRA
ncbi:hypothetical protein RvY_16398-2 [Ramazzottius varieornatus]|uniref:Receptor ligand binding region domain-containing protein n=1 Tax=Ramazzottius varieornatus TaxID=947166 RepID=A0A1D1W140_RAMVA|nr:hypothetical protein RvY_16398-2 [Ramazzottius varieornatus]